jgi:hypothetical protein
MSKAIIRGREMRLPASPLAEEQRLIYKEEGLRALALGHQRRRNGGGGDGTRMERIFGGGSTGSLTGAVGVAVGSVTCVDGTLARRVNPLIRAARWPGDELHSSTMAAVLRWHPRGTHIKQRPTDVSAHYNSVGSDLFEYFFSTIQIYSIKRIPSNTPKISNKILRRR